MTMLTAGREPRWVLPPASTPAWASGGYLYAEEHQPAGSPSTCAAIVDLPEQRLHRRAEHRVWRSTSASVVARDMNAWHARSDVPLVPPRRRGAEAGRVLLGPRRSHRTGPDGLRRRWSRRRLLAESDEHRDELGSSCRSSAEFTNFVSRLDGDLVLHEQVPQAPASWAPPQRQYVFVSPKAMNVACQVTPSGIGSFASGASWSSVNRQGGRQRSAWTETSCPRVTPSRRVGLASGSPRSRRPGAGRVVGASRLPVMMRGGRVDG